MLLRLILFCVAYIQIIDAEKNDVRPIVTTPYGKVRGLHEVSYNGRTYSEFFGIPYAKPPVGNLRYQNPEPIEKWRGIWEANFTISCAQLDHTADVGGNYIGHEDCLYLNIFVPSAHPKSGDDLAVIIDIHGGGFNLGSSTFYSGPKYLIDKNVIIVTFNYRLGPLGFLSTEDAALPGNIGMKDQVAALRWVKQNIKYFGGDPESITLSGLSAGGASVHYHYLSPLSKGIFKRGISISGTALCPWTMQENALKQARQLANSVGCLHESSFELVECLRQRPASQIFEATRQFRPWLMNPFSVFGLVVEKHGDYPFLPAHPYELMAKGKIQDLPWITSIVSHEGLYPAADFILQDHYLSELDEKWEELAEHVLHYEHTVPADQKKSVAKKIKEHYLNGKQISYDTYQEVISICSDRLFIVDSEKAARLQSKANKSPTYHYYFTYESEKIPTFTIHWAFSETRHGICHGDDVAMVFNNPHEPLTNLPKSDESMKDVLLEMWHSFARTGVPKVKDIEWAPVSGKGPFKYLHIMSSEEIEMKEINELGHRTFWDSLPIHENQHLFPASAKDEL